MAEPPRPLGGRYCGLPPQLMALAEPLSTSNWCRWCGEPMPTLTKERKPRLYCSARCSVRCARPSPLDPGEVVRLYRANLSTPRIATLLGCDPRSVRDTLVRAKEPLRAHTHAVTCCVCGAPTSEVWAHLRPGQRPWRWCRAHYREHQRALKAVRRSDP